MTPQSISTPKKDICLFARGRYYRAFWSDRQIIIGDNSKTLYPPRIVTKDTIELNPGIELRRCAIVSKLLFTSRQKNMSLSFLLSAHLSRISCKWQVRRRSWQFLAYYLFIPTSSTAVAGSKFILLEWHLIGNPGIIHLQKMISCSPHIVHHRSVLSCRYKEPKESKRQPR